MMFIFHRIQCEKSPKAAKNLLSNVVYFTIFYYEWCGFYWFSIYRVSFPGSSEMLQNFNKYRCNRHLHVQLFFLLSGKIQQYYIFCLLSRVNGQCCIISQKHHCRWKKYIHRVYVIWYLTIWCCSSRPGASWNVEYLFVITPKSSLARSLRIF